MTLVITSDGLSRTLYTEAIDLVALGMLTITRASVVEPNASGQWTVDLGPVSGPQLGPFLRRSEAIVAEVAWLEANRLNITR